MKQHGATPQNKALGSDLFCVISLAFRVVLWFVILISKAYEPRSDAK